MLKRLLTIGLFLGIALVHVQAAQGDIRGKVIALDDQLPLGGASVQLRSTLLGAATGSSGLFVIHAVPEGVYDLVISMVGYKRLQVSGIVVPQTGDSVPVFSLEPSAIQTAPVIISASKREQDIEEVPASISVLESRDLVQRQVVTVDDALRYVPGVVMTQSQVNIRGATGYSYGVGSRVLILVDGVPLLSGDTGEIIWESIPVQNIERIEVLKGAGSALYGSSALGGVINIITRPQADHAVTTLRTYGGWYELPSFSGWNWSGDLRTRGGISLSRQDRVGDLSYELGMGRSIDDGYRQNDYWKRWNAWSKVGYAITPMQSIALDFSLLDQHRGNFLYWKDLAQAFQPPDDELAQSVTSDRWRIAARYRNTLSSSFSLKVNGGWYHSRWSNNIPSLSDSGGTVSRSDAASLEVQGISQVSQAAVLSGGLVFNRNSVNASEIFGDRSGYGGAAYAQAEIHLYDNLLFTGGVRADLQKIETLDAFSRVNPKLGLTWQPDVFTSVRASVGTGFRTPAVAEIFTRTEAGGLTILPNPTLQPERSWSAEVGIRRSWSDLLSVDLAVFRNDVTDLIEPSFGSDGYVHFQNITHAVVTGSEIQLRSTAFSDRLPITLGYTYVDPEDESAHTVLKYRPRHSFDGNVALEYQPFTVGVDYRYLSRVERIDDELVLLGVVPDGDVRVPVSVLDCNVSVDVSIAGAPTTLAVHVKNLFRYYYTDFIGNIAPPRSVLFSLETQLP